MSLEATVERLCRVSVEQCIDPHSRIEWPERVDEEAWYTSPELVSLYGTPAYEELGERSATAQLLRGRQLLQPEHSRRAHADRGTRPRLYRRGQEAISPYLHHFLDEENKHMSYFGRFCTRYAGKVYPEKKLPFAHGVRAGREDFLFFAKVLVFEEIVDVYNRRMARDERIAPIAREIHWLHHFEEARHLVFGRELVAELFARHRAQWPDEVLRGVRATLAAYLGATWKEYYNPDAYRDAGPGRRVRAAPCRAREPRWSGPPQRGLAGLPALPAGGRNPRGGAAAVSEEARAREAIRSWVLSTSGRIEPAALGDDTPIFSKAVLESVHVMDLILLIEELSGRPIDVEKLRVGVFRTVDAIVANFFRGDESYFAD
jgi:hypothetical protein